MTTHDEIGEIKARLLAYFGSAEYRREHKRAVRILAICGMVALFIGITWHRYSYPDMTHIRYLMDFPSLHIVMFIGWIAAVILYAFLGDPMFDISDLKYAMPRNKRTEAFWKWWGDGK